MITKQSQNLEALIAAKTNLILTFGDPGSGKTCFLLALYKYLLLNKQWSIRHNVLRNKDKIDRMHRFIKNERKTGQLPEATNAGEIHELDLLIKPKYPDHRGLVSNNKERLFTFIDVAGEDCLHLLDFKSERGPIQQLLMPKLHTTFLYLMDFDEGEDKDLELALILDYLTEPENNIDRFGLIITKWDKNHKDLSESSFASEDQYLEHYMPGIMSQLDSLKEDTLDIKVFPFSIGQFTQSELGLAKLEGKMDLSFCEPFALWLHGGDSKNRKWKGKKQLSDFYKRYKDIIGFVSLLK